MIPSQRIGKPEERKVLAYGDVRGVGASRRGRARDQSGRSGVVGDDTPVSGGARGGDRRARSQKPILLAHCLEREG